jgi:hypothetical protein
MNPGGPASKLLLCALLVACGAEQKPAAAPPSLDTTLQVVTSESLPPPPPPLEDTITAALLAAGRQWGTTERDIRRILGTPDDVTTEPFQNQHDSTKTDTILRLKYRDLTLALYRVTESGKDILLQVILSRAGRPLPFGLDIGTRREDIVALRAPTGESLDDERLETLEYQGSMESPGLFRFVLRRDRVQRIEWAYFID